MSLKATTWAWSQDQLSDRLDLLVLLALADYANPDTDCCFPEQKSIAKKARCSVDSVQRALERLQVEGYVTRSRRTTTDGYRTSDLYKLHLDRNPLNKAATATTSGGLDRREPIRPENGDNPGDNQGTEPAKTASLNRKPKPHSCAVVTATSSEQLEPSSLSVCQGSEVRSSAQPATSAKPILTIRPGSAAWNAWMQHLERLKRSDVIELCKKHSLIQATQLWPKGDILPLRL